MPQALTDTVITGQVLHSWTIREYERHSRRAAWYVLMAVLGAALIGYALVSGNFLFALILILFFIILFLQSHQEAIVLPFSIAELGIIINNRFYPYSELLHFYIIYNPPQVKTLFIETKSSVRPMISVSLEDMDPSAVRGSLRNYLTEDFEKEEEPFADMLARSWQLH